MRQQKEMRESPSYIVVRTAAVRMSVHHHQVRSVTPWSCLRHALWRHA
jgi:hypothetical protein